MILTEVALRRRTFTGFALVALAAVGLLSYFDLPKAENPGFEIRTAIVLTRWPGATTAQMERLVTDPIESEIQRMEELDFVESFTRAGQSVVLVHIQETLTDLEPIWQDLRNKVSDARRALPGDVEGPNVNTDFGDVFGTVLAISSTSLSYRELESIAELAELALLELEDAGQVAIIGVPEDRIYIELDRAVLDAYGLSPGYLASLLSERNVLSDAGFVRGDRERLDIVASGSFSAIEEIEGVLIPLPGGASEGQSVPLGRLGHIRRGYADPPSTLAFFNGRPAVVVGVSLEEGGQITRLGPAVKEVAARLAQQLPRGVDLDFVAYQPGVVERKISNFVSNLIQGVVSVLIVTLVALGLRLGVVVGALIPMAILTSLAVMGFLGIGIDQMSLAALIISLGLLVDSGIVIAEAILVRVESGEEKLAAARGAVADLKSPLLVSVGTTVAALSPTFLAESATGEYTAPIAQVVAITLLAAWALAMTMTPLLCVLLLKGPEASGSAGGPRRTSRAYRLYRSVLVGALRHRYLVLPAAVLMLFGAFYLNRYVPKAFFPGKNINLVEAELELPFDASFPATRAMLARFEAELERFRAEDPKKDRGIIGYTSYVGSGGIRYLLGYAPEQPRTNYAYILIQTTDTELQPGLVEKVSTWTEEALPGVTLRMNRLRNGPPVDYPVAIRLSGLDSDRLYEHARKLKAKMAELDGLLAVNDNWYAPVKRIAVRVDELSERAASVSRSDIARSLRAGTSGLPVTVFREGTNLVPVYLRPDGGPELARLADLSVYDENNQEAIPLERMADLDLDVEPGQVFRYDRRRTITVRADIAPGSDLTAFSVAAELRPWLEDQKERWPVGYDFALGGSVEASGDAQESIFAKVPLAFAVILLLLVWQFNSLRKPLTILLMLPFGLVGVVLALLVTQKAFGFMSLLGVIALFGVLINNALVLISEFEQRLHDAPSRFEAVVGASERRVRPILLTTLTTVGGLIPLALFGGPLFSPLGTAMLGGLVIATLVTLVLCPTIFATLYRIREDEERRR